MDVAAVDSYRKVARQDQCHQLILEHLDFVRHILGRLAAEFPPGVDLENLESAGVLGLIEAAHQFDRTRGVPFSAFAYPRIRGAVIDELRRNCPLPQHVLQRWTLIRDAYSRLEAPVGPEELAELTGLTVDQVLTCVEAVRLTNPESWLDEMSCDRRDRSQTPAPEATLERHEEQQILADAIEQLPERERQVLTLYYQEDLRLKEIGQVIDLSESRVSRVLAAAEMRLKSIVRRMTDA